MTLIRIDSIVTVVRQHLATNRLNRNKSMCEKETTNLEQEQKPSTEKTEAKKQKQSKRIEENGMKNVKMSKPNVK